LLASIAHLFHHERRAHPQQRRQVVNVSLEHFDEVLHREINVRLCAGREQVVVLRRAKKVRKRIEFDWF